VTEDTNTEEGSLDEVLQELEELEETVDSQAERDELADVRRAVQRLPGGAFIGKRIERYTTRDVAESFVGSIIISLPLLVEDGVFDIGEHFVESTVAGIPVWLVGNVAFIVALTWGLLYWSEFRQVREPNPILGLVPRRLVGALAVSLFTATLTMTLWGRVEWGDPVEAFARISVIWAAAAFGAALGDIIPGESTGTELRDVPEEVGGRVERLGKGSDD